ncbi:MAG: LysM peptidoglycan-binding domain-containing C40 family peptidase [Candidatus Eremiobacteraeota bacterium]|nr:LysM peptidoglycan-binding domain-containing C40 family peptidase [Candidatus Eremiobacteraeota bacterium]
MFKNAAALATAFALWGLTAGPSSAAAPEYTIVKGDTLQAIARLNHMSVRSLEAANRLTAASVLHIGQRVSLSNPASRQLGHASRPLQLAIRRALWQATHAGSGTALPLRPASIAQAVSSIDVSITKTALRYIGVPYAWGGTSFAGVDCSGFVQTVFYQHGILLPRTADAQFSVGTRVATSGLRRGDLVFFETYAAGASHVGIYLGGGRFVHASSSSGVRVDRLSEAYYASRFIGGRRLIN